MWNIGAADLELLYAYLAYYDLVKVFGHSFSKMS